ncbi:asparaginase [soil metagenome]
MSPSRQSAAANPVLVEVIRGGHVESVHRGSALVLAADGCVVAAVGDPGAVTFPRSAVKPIQAIGMLQAGLGLQGAPLSIATGSHSGEPEHADLVRRTLQAAGLSVENLQCPPALPMNEAARNAVLAAGGGPRREYMNCSGKHTAMLLTCLANHWPVESYLDSEHPLQVHLCEVLADYSGEALDPATVDGCGAPLYGMTLTGLARSFLRLAEEAGPVRVVADAMQDYPFFVAGTGREDTALMIELPPRLAKAGAEGVHAAAVPGLGAVVVKIDDGNERARMPGIVAGLRRLGLGGPVLDRWETGTVGGGGRPVGTVQATDGLFR